jgi:hypothetical protein
MWSKFSICKRQCFKTIKTSTILKTHFVSIYKLKVPRTCLTKKPTFKNWPLWVYHKFSGFAHIGKRINDLWNKANSPITNAHEDSSMEIPILNMLIFSSSFSKANPSTRTIASSWIVGFNYLKIVIKRGWLLSHHIQL